MRKHLLALSLLLGASCAHTRVTGWSDGQLTVCGNKRATQADFQAEAESHGCQSPYAAQGLTRQTGAHIKRNLFTGEPLGVEESTERCVVFTCARFSNVEVQ